jgi:hypothetical protein
LFGQKGRFPAPATIFLGVTVVAGSRIAEGDRRSRLVLDADAAVAPRLQ